MSSSAADQLRAIAADRFGWPELRAGQLEAMEALLRGQDVLVVMPTGAGKSAVYQVPALLLDGPTVVVSPLIALQRDQIAGLDGTTAPEAVAVNSAQRVSETERAWEVLRNGDAEYVFLAPEQLAKDEVIEQLAELAPSLFVVDEAHCVSAWGHDFRPDYLRLADAIERLGRPTVVALTATAAPPVRAEILERLRVDGARQVVRGFDRPNIELAVERFVEDADKRAAVVARVLAERAPGIVYAGTRNDTEGYATALQDEGLRAAAYHAGLRAADRHQVHESFLAGELDVVVATTAFGMGIDKPDVRYVLHAHVSESLDSYYQEIGRAGRDGEPATARLLYRPEDLGLRAYFTSGRPNEEALGQVAATIAGATTARKASNGVTLAGIREATGLSRNRVTQAVNLLELAGVVRSGNDRRHCYADASLAVSDAVTTALEVADARQRVDKSRVEMMRGYAETVACRRQFLLGYFGEELAEPCGACDACANGLASEPTVGLVGQAPFPLNAEVSHAEWGRGVVMRPELDRVTVLFESVGYKTLALEMVQADGLLVRLDT